MSKILPAGYQLGAYVIQGIVGRGGMGVVYAAEHTTLRRRVALKVVAPEVAEDAAFRDRFLREARLAASLHHPNIIEVYDAGQVGTDLYLAMRYVEGASLATLLRLAGRFEPDRALSILAKVASALDEAHANGLIHRDVKPDNILIAPGTGRGASEEVFLTDFGLVRRIDADTRITQTGYVLGTLSYLAPEVFQGGEIDGRSDEYSLACVVYECLTGRVPFSRELDAATLVAHLTSPPPAVSDDRPDLTAWFDAVLQQGMAKAKEDRYATCAEFIQEARAALGRSAPASGPSEVATEVVTAPAPGHSAARPTHTPATEPLTPGPASPRAPHELDAARTTVAVRSTSYSGIAVAALAIALMSVALAVALPVALRPGAAAPTTGVVPGSAPTLETGSPGSAAGGGTWLRTGSLSEARWGHGATLLANGQVLVVGGNITEDSSSALASAELYDAASASWTPAVSMRQPRAYPSVTALMDGKVLVAGGAFDNAPLALAELYDPASASWSSLKAMKVARSQHTATLLNDGRVLVVGGGTSTRNRASTASAEIFDPAAGTWTQIAPMEVARSYHTATLLDDGRVLVVGGSSMYLGGTVTASAEIFDPRTGRWTATGAMPTRRYVHEAVRLRDGRVLVAGGWSSTTLDARSLSSAAIFDPATGEWAAVGDMSKGRAQFRMASLPDGRVLAVGGLSPGLLPQASADLFDPASRSWSATGAMLDASWWPILVVLPDGRALVAGGASDRSGAAPLTSAELYAPPPR